MIQPYRKPEEEDLSPDEIAADIEASRHRIDVKLNALKETLTPQRLVDSATESLTSHSFDETLHHLSRGFARARAEIRKRPVGTALMAAGLVAFAIESARSTRKKEPLASAPPSPTPYPPHYTGRSDPARREHI